MQMRSKYHARSAQIIDDHDFSSVLIGLIIGHSIVAWLVSNCA